MSARQAFAVLATLAVCTIAMPAGAVAGFPRRCATAA